MLLSDGHCCADGAVANEIMYCLRLEVRLPGRTFSSTINTLQFFVQIPYAFKLLASSTNKKGKRQKKRMNIIFQVVLYKILKIPAGIPAGNFNTCLR